MDTLMQLSAALLNCWRPALRYLLAELPFPIYVYGGEAYHMYFELSEYFNTKELKKSKLPFRPAMDIDAVLISKIS